MVTAALGAMIAAVALVAGAAVVPVAAAVAATVAEVVAVTATSSFGTNGSIEFIDIVWRVTESENRSRMKKPLTICNSKLRRRLSEVKKIKQAGFAVRSLECMDCYVLVVFRENVSTKQVSSA